MVLGGLQLARRGLLDGLAEEERQEDLARFELHRAGVPPDYGALCRRERALHNLAGGFGLGLWQMHAASVLRPCPTRQWISTGRNIILIQTRNCS